MIAVYFQVDNTTLDQLKQAQGDNLLQQIEALEGQANIPQVDIGKLWDVMHFILTEKSASTPVPDSPFSEMLVGVETFSDDEDADFIAYCTWAEIAEIVEALEQVNFAKRLEKMKLKSLRQAKLFPEGIWNDKKPNLDKELLASFNELKALYENALDGGDNVVVTIL
ncbi:MULTISPECIES: YfbM family protein [unclassified Moraxella]|uniref:YfbM family protein n=1 Tax=unclassified Moraxella TaxID=2685852 RepID=UPI003AF520C1